MNLYGIYFKRLIDVIISSIGIIVFCPIILTLAMTLILVYKGSPFFLQSRPGKDEKIFKLIKFKTMIDKRDIHGNLLPDNLRMTKIGAFIRKTSLDELPQLINVLKGDMSLVGPRPLLVEYLTLYNAEQKKRHLVKPGITGWAQVNGRNAISWQGKFNYDIFYVDNVSLSLDVTILFMTIRKVFISEGINAAESVTMEKFTGNSQALN